MSNINTLLNYYIENSYLNLNNNITIEDLKLLKLININNNIKKFNIIITIINIPANFKYYNIIQQLGIQVKIYNY